MVEITKIRIKKVRTQYQNIIYIDHENSNQNIGCDNRKYNIKITLFIFKQNQFNIQH